VARAFYVRTYGDGGDYRFSRDFATGPVNGGDDVLQIMGPPSGNTQTVATELGSSSIGTFTVPLLDRDGEVMRYLGNPARLLAVGIGPADDVIYATGPVDGYPARTTLIIGAERIRATTDPDRARFIYCQRGVDGTSAAEHMAGARIDNGEQLRAGQRLQLYAGYDDVPFVDFLRIAKMEITGISLAPDGVTFLMAIADIQRSMRRSLFTTRTSENQLTMAENPITLALRLMLSSGTAAEIGGTCQVVEDNVVVGTSDFTLFNPGDYVLIDIETATEQLAQISRIVDPSRFVSSLPLTPTDAGKRFRRAGSNGKYDVLRRSDALQLPPALVDIEGLEALRAQEFPDDRFHFKLNTAEADGKSFIEREIWQPNNCYPFITQDGKYSARRYKPAPESVDASLTEDDIITWAWDGGERQIANEIQWLYDFNLDAAPDNFSTRQRYTSSPEVGSIQAFGLRPPIRISSRGLRTEDGAQPVIDERSFQLLQRFSAPPPILRVAVLYSRHVLDIGDTVAVTHSLVPNRKTGKRGLVNEVFEVRDMSPVFGATGRVALTLLHTGAQEVIPTPASDGPENAIVDLLIFGASFFNQASVALGTNVETETGSVTVTALRAGDQLHITARQYISSAGAGTTPTDVTSRIRIGSTLGELADGIMPQSFVAATTAEGKGGGITLFARRGIVKHDVTFVAETAGPITVIMSGHCPSAGANARDRSMTVTVRSR
jgi:hypothetical protein